MADSKKRGVISPRLGDVSNIRGEVHPLCRFSFYRTEPWRVTGTHCGSGDGTVVLQQLQRLRIGLTGEVLLKSLSEDRVTCGDHEKSHA